MKLHGQWLARWLVHGSTIITQSFMERPLETSAGVGVLGQARSWPGGSGGPDPPRTFEGDFSESCKSGDFLWG